MSLGQGELLVKFARKAIQSYLNEGKVISVPSDFPREFIVPGGVFVTLNKVLGDNRELRGCIGFPEPIYPLGEATVRSAISAATRDPRFPPVELSELAEIVIEVSVLTRPEYLECLDSENYTNHIKVGRDGLVVERGRSRGLLLPQVAVEWNWDAEEFLMQCCIKAGLPPDSWLIDGTKIYKFQGRVFSEVSPNGPIREMPMAEGNR